MPNYAVDVVVVGATDGRPAVGGEPALPAGHPCTQGGHLVPRTICQGQCPLSKRS